MVEVLDLEELALGVVALIVGIVLAPLYRYVLIELSTYVFREAAVEVENAVCREVLAQKSLASPAVEAVWWEFRVSEQDCHRDRARDTG